MKWKFIETQKGRTTIMLVLSRKRDESILIGSNGEIEVKILGVEGDNVRLGIHAARDIDIHRQEVFERIQNRKDQNKDHKQQEQDKEEEKVIAA